LGAVPDADDTAGAQAALRCCREAINPPALEDAKKGVAWLTEKNTPEKSSLTGLYFARLWYYERLYKSIFSVLVFQHKG
jgi:hypothetical protein